MRYIFKIADITQYRLTEEDFKGLSPRSKPPMLEELRRLQTQMHTLGTRSTAIAAEMVPWP